MSKLDLNLKINFFDFLQNLKFKGGKSPDILLREKFLIPKKLKPFYFNWGRNALFYLFKTLKFQKIAFPAFTCPTLVEAALKAKKEVELVEIDLRTFNLDIEKIPSQTECLVAVHTFGNPLDISLIRKRFKSLYIIEDCAHALFSKLNNKYVGNLGDAILFSFYKQIANLNGALLFSSQKITGKQKEERLLKYWKRLIFKTAGWHQCFLDFKRKGYLPKIESQPLNNNLPNRLSLFLFTHHFEKLEKETENKVKISQFYFIQARKIPQIYVQESLLQSRPSFYQFAIRLHPKLASRRDKIVWGLRKKGVITDRLWYSAPICQPRFKKWQKKCPNALLLAKTIINLPIRGSYNQADINDLFSKLKKTIRENK